MGDRVARTRGGIIGRGHVECADVAVEGSLRVSERLAQLKSGAAPAAVSR